MERLTLVWKILKRYLGLTRRPQRLEQSVLLPLALSVHSKQRLGPDYYVYRQLSRAIDFDRLDLAAVTMHVDSDWTTTNFAILNRGKGAG